MKVYVDSEDNQGVEKVLKTMNGVSEGLAHRRINVLFFASYVIPIFIRLKESYGRLRKERQTLW